MDVKKELENLTAVTYHEPDWKRILRDVLKDANHWDMENTGEPPVWTFQMTDERMKELEQMMEQDQPAKEGAK